MLLPVLRPEARDLRTARKERRDFREEEQDVARLVVEALDVVDDGLGPREVRRAALLESPGHGGEEKQDGRREDGRLESCPGSRHRAMRTQSR